MLENSMFITPFFSNFEVCNSFHFFSYIWFSVYERSGFKFPNSKHFENLLVWFKGASKIRGTIRNVTYLISWKELTLGLICDHIVWRFKSWPHMLESVRGLSSWCPKDYKMNNKFWRRRIVKQDESNGDPKFIMIIALRGKLLKDK